MKPDVAAQKLVDVIRRQHKSLSTERTYKFWLWKYMAFISWLSPEIAWTPEKKFEAWLTKLARDNVSASTQNQAFNAILFFYGQVLGQPLKQVDALRATRPQQVRLSLPEADTLRLLEAVPNHGGYPTKLVVRLIYGAGLRVSEAISLRVKDIDLIGSRLFIMGGKGAKDRVVRLPCSAAIDIKEQLVWAKVIWERDKEARVPVELPHLLARKYPYHQFSWAWAWVFPMHRPCRHPRDKTKIVRWHLLADNVQRAVRVAARKLDLSATPHVLRHCYATHLLDRGRNITAVAKAMGHESIETTQGYCHAEALSVGSPLDLIQ